MANITEIQMTNGATIFGLLNSTHNFIYDYH